MQWSNTFHGHLSKLELTKCGIAQKGLAHGRLHVQWSAPTALESKVWGAHGKALETAEKFPEDNPWNEILALGGLATWMHFVRNFARLSSRMDRVAQ